MNVCHASGRIVELCLTDWLEVRKSRRIASVEGSVGRMASDPSKGVLRQCAFRHHHAERHLYALLIELGLNAQQNASEELVMALTICACSPGAFVLSSTWTRSRY